MCIIIVHDYIILKSFKIHAMSLCMNLIHEFHSFVIQFKNHLTYEK